MEKGREDYRKHRDYDPSRHTQYRNADDGYKPSYGDRRDYVDNTVTGNAVHARAGPLPSEQVFALGTAKPVTVLRHDAEQTIYGATSS
jgi:hypothetical protein